MRKLYCLIVLLFLAGGVLAQGVDTARKDTSKYLVTLDAPSKVTNDKPLYVVDGIILKKDPEKINPNEILKINVLKDAESIKRYGSKGAHGVIVITSRQFAIEQYQKKFTAFSKGYSDYLKTHENKDSDFNYILNGFPLEGKPDEIIERLFEVRSESINNVTFLDKSKDSQLVKSTLIITALKK